jgi:hypothetical protein
MHGSRRLLTYSNVASTLALVVALGGGTAYAAARIGSADIIDDSIRSRDLRDSDVRGRDLAAASVTSPKLAAGSVDGDKVLDDSLTLADLAPSAKDAIEAEGRAVATGLVKFVTTDGGSTYQPELVSSHTRNITAVRRSGFTPGYYCLTPAEGVTLTGRPAIGTPDWNSTYGDQLHVYVDSSNNECSPGELAVVTNTGTGAGRSILPFYIVVF